MDVKFLVLMNGPVIVYDCFKVMPANSRAASDLKCAIYLVACLSRSGGRLSYCSTAKRLVAIVGGLSVSDSRPENLI